MSWHSPVAIVEKDGHRVRIDATEEAKALWVGQGYKIVDYEEPPEPDPAVEAERMGLGAPPPEPEENADAELDFESPGEDADAKGGE